MTDPEHEILALHLRNLHTLLNTVDLRLRRIEAALGYLARIDASLPLGPARVVKWVPVGEEGGEDPEAA